MRALWLVPALALTLTGCSGVPSEELRGNVEAVTLAANDGSAQGVRDAVQELLSTLRAQVAGGDIDRAKAERLRELALRIEREAGLLEPAQPSAPPLPVEEPSPAEEPTPEPEPTEEPEPEPTQEPEPEPEPTQEPEPEQSVEVVVPPVEESPSSQSQGGAASPPPASPAA